MSRTALLLLVLLVARAHAENAPAAGFDQVLAAQVYVAALAFMAPRTLEPVPVPQLTTWGLHGLTAIDPDIGVDLGSAGFVLSVRDRIIAARPPPAGGTPAMDAQTAGLAAAWGGLAAELAAAAWPASPALRRAGTQGIIQAFFDEVFNHLDPYSRYVGPADAEEDRDRRIGTAGAGITLAAGRRGTIVVVAAIPDGAAAEAGIKVGDRIVAVDGEQIRGKSADEIAELIEGPAGSRVTIDWRGRDGRLRSAELERASVPPETVFAERLGASLLVRVSAFSRLTDDRLAHEVERGRAAARPVDGVVIDLRGNRGGLLREAVTAADVFLGNGIVAVTAGRDPAASRLWRSTGGELTENLPVVVLVDGRTASAAEILAGALLDRGRAVIVGSATLGKGLVQTIAPLPDGGELFVTWSRVLAPRGWPIQGLGVLPQICTSLGRLELERELAELAAGRQPMAAALQRHEQARAPLPVAEILAIRSACPAAEGRDGDLAAARYLIGNPAAYATALMPPLRDPPTLAGRP